MIELRSFSCSSFLPHHHCSHRRRTAATSIKFPTRLTSQFTKLTVRISSLPCPVDILKNHSKSNRLALIAKTEDCFPAQPHQSTFIPTYHFHPESGNKSSLCQISKISSPSVGLALSPEAHCPTPPFWPLHLTILT